MSLSGSSEFWASSLFKVGSSSVNRALPFWFIHGISLQVSRIDVAPLEIGFDRVFIPQFWSTLISFAGLKFPVHQASRHPTLLHLNHMSNPSKLGLDDGGLYAGGLSLIGDLQIGDVVLPPDSQDRAKRISWRRVCRLFIFAVSRRRSRREPYKNVDPLLQILDSMGQHTDEKDVEEDRG